MNLMESPNARTFWQSTSTVRPVGGQHRVVPILPRNYCHLNWVIDQCSAENEFCSAKFISCWGKHKGMFCASQLCMTVPKPERSIRNQKSHEVVTKCDKLESELQEFCKCGHITTFHPISSDLCRWIVTQLLNPRAASCSPVIRRSESVRNSPPKTTESMEQIDQAKAGFNV